MFRNRSDQAVRQYIQIPGTTLNGRVSPYFFAAYEILSHIPPTGAEIRERQENPADDKHHADQDPDERQRS